MRCARAEHALGAIPLGRAWCSAPSQPHRPPHSPTVAPPPSCVPEVFLEEEIFVAEESDEITLVVEPSLVVDTSKTSCLISTMGNSRFPIPTPDLPDIACFVSYPESGFNYSDLVLDPTR